MNSIFLRIYGGMLAALVLVALLGFMTLHLVNQVRGDEYREGLARGTFRLMADNLQPMNRVERHRALLQWERLLGIPLDLQALDEQPLDNHARERLRRGQVLVIKDGHKPSLVYSLLSGPEELVLVGEVQQISEQLARATVYLLSDELVRYPVAEQPERLAQLKQAADEAGATPRWQHQLRCGCRDGNRRRRRRGGFGRRVQRRHNGGHGGPGRRKWRAG